MWLVKDPSKEGLKQNITIMCSVAWFVFVHCQNIIKQASSPTTRHGGTLGERRYSSYSFSTLALDGGEWSASRPGRAFTPGERTPSTHCTGGWVGLRAGLDTEVRGKILCPRRGSNPDRPVVQPVVRHYTELTRLLDLSMRHHIPSLNGDFSLTVYYQNDEIRFNKPLFSSCTEKIP
jgi:hypothetical protein